MTESSVHTSPGAAVRPAPAVRHHDHSAPVLSALGLFTVLLGAALPLIDFFIVNV
ncbi:MFS transporter, partial [Streptomyces sp. SID8455]|nr:MFS transporter [Streptomyces sp. SID8455]